MSFRSLHPEIKLQVFAAVAEAATSDYDVREENAAALRAGNKTLAGLRTVCLEWDVRCCARTPDLSPRRALPS